MATLTNSICTNGVEIDIQSGTGALKIGTKASANTITIGNVTGTTGLTINLGSAGITIPKYSSFGVLVTTSSGVVTDNAAGASGTILTSNGTSSLPTYQAFNASSIVVDNTTVSLSLASLSSIGSAVATGTNPEYITSYTISGTQYISITNNGAATFSTYSWNGTTFASVGSDVATGTNPQGITSFNISGTQYISIVNHGANTFSTYSWNGSAFVSVGAAVATGTSPFDITSFTISGTQYVSITNSGAATFSTYSWNGSAFVSVGAAVATLSSPRTLTSYLIAGTQYISIINNNTLGTYSWNGSAFVLVGSTVSTGSSGNNGITSYIINGTPYLSISSDQGLGTGRITTFAWNGTAFATIGTGISIGNNSQLITSYTVGTIHYVSAVNQDDNTFSTLAWNGRTFVSIGADVNIGNGGFGITSYTIGTTQYISVGNGSDNTFSTFSGLPQLTATGTFTGGLSTAPVSSATATAAFVTSLTAGTSVQNTTGYDLLVNICVNVTSATTATLTLGIGPKTGPAVNTVITTFTAASTTLFTFTAIVPNQFFLLVNTTGTITVASINAQSCPL